MFDLVPSHPVATDSAFQHLTQLTMMMMMMMMMIVVVLIMTMTLTMMTMTLMTLMVMLITLTPDAVHEATVPALTVDRPSQKPLFAVGPRCKF